MADRKNGAGELLFTLSVYAAGVCIVTGALMPSGFFAYRLWLYAADFSPVLRILILSFSLVLGYLIYGFSLLLLTGGLRAGFGLHLKEGEYSPNSPEARKWFLLSSWGLIVSVTFMEFILLTPAVNFFYKLMGAVVGKNVLINSKYCSDPGLLEIGDNSVIGGHATVIGHSFEGGKLILKKVKIGKNVSVGLNAVVLPGSRIHDGAVIGAGAVVLKNTVVPAGTLFAGVPAALFERK